MERKILSRSRRLTVLWPVVFAFVLSCGKTKEEQKQPAVTPELQRALEIVENINPDVDSIEEIIAQYKNAKKVLSDKVLKGTPTLEEKYVYFLVDTFLLAHQLVNFISELAKAIISGKIDAQTVTELIDKLPKSPEAHSLKTMQGYHEWDLTLPYGCDDISGISMTLCSAMDGILVRRIETGIKLLREIQEEIESKRMDFRMNIKSMPMKVELVVIRYSLDFGGEHDLGMIYFFESALNLIDAIFRLIFSLSFDGLGGVTEIPRYLEKVSFSEDVLLHAGRVLSFILKNNPSFFDISSTLEVVRVREQIKESIVKTQKFLQYVREKNADSPNSILYYSSEESEYRIRYYYDGELKEASLMKERDVETFMKAVSNIMDNIEGRKKYISSQDLVYIAVTNLIAAVRSGLFEPVVDVVIDLFGQEQARTIRKFMDSQLFTPGALAGVVAGILGDVFYFDIKGVFDNAIKGDTRYREWLPAWTVYLGNFEDNLVIEWDCGAKLYDKKVEEYKEYRKKYFGLSCSAPSGGSLQDIGHFSDVLTTSIKFEGLKGWGDGDEIAMPPDGIPSEFPYILFQDPSFGGLVLIKGSSLVTHEIRGFLEGCGVDLSETPQSYFGDRKRGNCALNAAIQRIIGKLLTSL